MTSELYPNRGVRDDSHTASSVDYQGVNNDLWVYRARRKWYMEHAACSPPASPDKAKLARTPSHSKVLQRLGALKERAVDKGGERKRKPFSQIALYYANITGYVRLMLAAVAMALPRDRYYAIAFSYLLSCFLDFIDGPLARKFNQCSKFGILLDYSTDIIAKVGIVMRLTHLWPEWTLPAFLFILEECAGVIFVSFLTGSGKYWKNTNEPWWIQQVYIQNGQYTWTGYFLQFFSNVFLSALYCSYFVSGSTWLTAVMVLSVPSAVANLAENSTILIDILAAWKE